MAFPLSYSQQLLRGVTQSGTSKVFRSKGLLQATVATASKFQARPFGGGVVAGMNSTRKIWGAISSFALRTPVAEQIQINGPMGCCGRLWDFNARRSLFSLSARCSGPLTFRLADIGEGIAEVELLQWFVKEGDSIEEMDPVCEVQSDKSAVEISSPYTGKILKFHHAIGDNIKIGGPLIEIDVESGDAPAEDSASQKQPDAAPVDPAGPSRHTAVRGGASTPGSDASAAKDTRSMSVQASPACRALALQHGIDLNKITGTGPKGRVLKEDVLHYLADTAVTPTPAPTAEQRVPTPSAPAVEQFADREPSIVMLKTGVAKGMVKSMEASLQVPRMAISEECDITDLLRIRGEMKTFIGETNKGEKLTLTPLVVKAISSALKQVPILNSKFDSQTRDRYTLFPYHNVCIAMDTPLGLLVPNIKNVDMLSLREIQTELNRLQELAFAGKLGPAQLTGGTISLSNVGPIGGSAVQPILFDGQAAIFGIGRTQTLPRFRPDGTVAPREIVNVTASVDHRHIDGATVARFMGLLRKFLENPALMML